VTVSSVVESVLTIAGRVVAGETEVIDFLVIATALALGGYLAFSARLASSTTWQAMVTPLASIMGSGFLVSAPLLAGIAGVWAVFAMALLLILAYLIGGAIRFNIVHFEPIEHAQSGPAQVLGFMSRIALAGAYFISVTYYLELLSAFILRLVALESTWLADVITTSLLVTICGIGMWRGLRELEAVEKYAVAFNLGMIGALLTGLVAFNATLFIGGKWSFPAVSADLNVHDFRVLLGLLIIVQGFETSRYLGDAHPAALRIATMRGAQLVSGAIYLVFVALATVLFHDGLGVDVTAIMSMTAPVALVLPFLVALAAMGSQFSAAVADDEGAGGLIEDLSERKIPLRYAYLVIMLVTVGLTWSVNVNEIIAYASRAFALYYTLQCAVATAVAWRDPQLRRPGTLARFAALTIACFLVFLLGIPSG